MTTAPFDPSVAQLLPQSHEQSVRLVAELVNGTQIPLDVLDYSIDWDETRTPRVQASFDVVVPDTQATLDQLDPRMLVRVRLYATYRLPSGVEDEHQVAKLHLRQRRLARDGDGNAVLTLDAASSEALFMDGFSANLSADGESVYAAPDLRTAIVTYVTECFAGTPLTGITVVGPALSTGPVNIPNAPHPWDGLSDAADQYDIDIYDPGDELFHVEPRPVNVGPASLALTHGTNGTIVSSQTGVTRDDWANWVVVYYRWTNSAGVQLSDGGSAGVTGGPYGTAGSGYKFLPPILREMKGDHDAADRAARVILRRMLARSRSYTVEAVPAWWVRPGQTITLQLPLGSQERHLVSRVGFAPGRMQIETRLPDTASIIGE